MNKIKAGDTVIHNNVVWNVELIKGDQARIDVDGLCRWVYLDQLKKVEHVIRRGDRVIWKGGPYTVEVTIPRFELAWVTTEDGENGFDFGWAKWGELTKRESVQ